MTTEKTDDVNEASEIVTQLAEAEAEEDLGRESEDFFAVNIPALLEALANLPQLPDGVSREDFAVYGLSGWLGRREHRIAVKLEELEHALEKTKMKNHKMTEALKLLENEVDFLETKLEAATTESEKFKLQAEKIKFEAAKEKDLYDRSTTNASELEATRKKVDELEYQLSLEKGAVVRLQLNVKALQEELQNYKSAEEYPGELEKLKKELQDLHTEHERVKIQLREQMQHTDELQAELITSSEQGTLLRVKNENQQLLEQNHLLAQQLQTYKDQLYNLEVTQDKAMSQATLVFGDFNEEAKKKEEEQRRQREETMRQHEETTRQQEAEQREREAEIHQREAEEKMKEMEQIRIDLQKQVQALKSELETSQAVTVTRKDTTNETMLRQISHLNDERSRLMNEIDELNDLVDSLSREKTTLTERIESLEEERKALEEKSATFTIDTHALHEQHRVLETIIKKKDEEIQHLIQDLEKLKIELNVLRDQFNKTSDDLRQCREDTHHLQRQQSQVDTQQLRQDAEQAKQELDKAKDHLTKLESKLKQVESENAQLEKTAAAEIEYLRNTNRKLSAKISELEAMMEDGESTKDQVLVSDQAAKIEHLEMQVAELRKQRSQLRNALEDRLQGPDGSEGHSQGVETSPRMSPVPQESPAQPLVEPRNDNRIAAEYMHSLKTTGDQVMKELDGKLPHVDQEVTDGWNLWHIAVWSRQTDLFVKLSRASVHKRTQTLGWTPLHLAIAVNDPNLMTQFLKAVDSSVIGDLIGCQDHLNNTPLQLALILQSDPRHKITFNWLIQSLVTPTFDSLQSLTRAQAILRAILECADFKDPKLTDTMRSLFALIAPAIHRPGLFPPLKIPHRSEDLVKVVPELARSIDFDQAVKFAPTVQFNSDDLDLAEELKAASKSIRKAISDEKDEIRLTCPGDQLRISRSAVLYQILKEYPEPEQAARSMYSGLCYKFEFGSSVTRSLSLCVVLAGRLMLWEFVQASPDGQIGPLGSPKTTPLDAVLKLRKEDCQEFKLADLIGITMFSNVECFIVFDVANRGQILIESPDRLLLHKYLVMNFRLATSLRVYHPSRDYSWSLNGERLNLTVSELPVALPIKDGRGALIGSLLTLKFPTKIRGAECIAVPNSLGTSFTHVATASPLYRAACLRIDSAPNLNEPLETLKVDPATPEMFCMLFTSGQLIVYKSPTDTKSHAIYQVGADSVIKGFDRTLPPPEGGSPNKVFGAFKDFFNRALSSTLIEPGLYGIDLNKHVLLFFDEPDQRDDWLRALIFTSLAQPLAL